MKSRPAPSEEFERFDQLVGQVLAVPKADVKRAAEQEKTVRPSKSGRRSPLLDKSAQDATNELQ